MAEATQGRGRTAPTAEEETAAETLRLVLKRERVIVLPDNVPEGAKVDLAKLAEALGLPKTAAAKLVTADEAWIPVAERPGSNMQQAIYAYTGAPGLPDTKVGSFKAPPARSWKGGKRLVAPPKPLVEAEAID